MMVGAAAGAGEKGRVCLLLTCACVGIFYGPMTGLAGLDRQSMIIHAAWAPGR